MPTRWKSVPLDSDVGTMPKSSEKAEFLEGEKESPSHLRGEHLIYILTNPGTELRDPEGLFEGRIFIDDAPPLKFSRPLAYLILEGRTGLYIEVIDIIGSVKANPILVGHPVVVTAIARWAEIAKFERAVDPLGAAANVVTTAKDYLRKIGKALLDGANENRMSREEALQLHLQRMNSYRDDTYLRIAWDRLAKRFIVDWHSAGERVAAIELYLSAVQFFAGEITIDDLPDNLEKLPKQYAKRILSHGIKETDWPYLRQHIKLIRRSNHFIPINEVIEFLRTDQGSRFVYDEVSFDNLRPKWLVFYRSFWAWRLEIAPATLATYLKRARASTANSETARPLPHLYPASEIISQSLQSSLSAPFLRFGYVADAPLSFPQIRKTVHNYLSQMGTKELFSNPR